MDKKAFTLAEVLITLTIIGVIAAITIPNLMQSWKKHHVEVSVKEAYSILSNAIKMSETENGNSIEWNFTLKEDVFAKQYIFPYLKINKICGSRRVMVNPGQCFAEENGDANFQTLKGTKNLYIGHVYMTAIMANGMSIGILSSQGVWGEPSAMFAVDIDGPAKGKSVIGKDVFFFTLTGRNSDKTKFFPGMDNWNRGYVNKSLSELSGTTGVYGACNTESTGSSEVYDNGQCALVIMKNGWKIPDNYPVKKW